MSHSEQVKVQLLQIKGLLVEAPLSSVITEVDTMDPGDLPAAMEGFEARVRDTLPAGPKPVEEYLGTVVTNFTDAGKLFSDTASGSGIDAVLSAVEHVGPMTEATGKLTEAVREAATLTETALTHVRIALASLESAVVARQVAADLAEDLHQARTDVVNVTEKLMEQL